MAPTACKRTVSGSFSLPCPGSFSPFPHGTCPLSVSQEYLALADGAARFRQDSSGPALLRVSLDPNKTSGTRLSRSTAGLSRPLPCIVYGLIAALQPRNCRNSYGLGCSAFAHHYSRNHYCSLLLRVLRCFSSPRSPRFARCHDCSWRVPPFGYPRITGHLRLPAAFRSLSRPSSPLGATGIPRALLFTFSCSFSSYVYPSSTNMSMISPGPQPLCVRTAPFGAPGL